MENNQEDFRITTKKSILEPGCVHEWHKMWFAKGKSVCYRCRAIKENASGAIIREFKDYKDKLPRRLQ